MKDNLFVFDFFSMHTINVKSMVALFNSIIASSKVIVLVDDAAERTTAIKWLTAHTNMHSDVAEISVRHCGVTRVNRQHIMDCKERTFARIYDKEHKALSAITVIDSRHPVLWSKLSIPNLLLTTTYHE